jgi:hypothetical protein
MLDVNNQLAAAYAATTTTASQTSTGDADFRMSLARRSSRTSPRRRCALRCPVKAGALQTPRSSWLRSALRLNFTSPERDQIVKGK